MSPAAVEGTPSFCTRFQCNHTLNVALLLLLQMVAGLLGPATNWRVPFVVMAAPTLALVVLLLLTVKEPARGGVYWGLETALGLRGVGK